MIGTHIIADLKKVDFSQLEITEQQLKQYIDASLEKSGLHQLWSHYHTFDNSNEITCVVALAESHLSIHTWPEKQYVSLDIFVCNMDHENSDKAQQLYQEIIALFNPWDIEKQVLSRSHEA